MQLVNRLRVVPVADERYIMLNGLTGTMNLIDESVYQLYLKWQSVTEIIPDHSELDIFNTFKKHKCIMNSGEEDILMKKLLTEMEQYYSNLRNSIVPTFVLTYDCNFRCSYCYEKKILQKDNDQIRRRMTDTMVKNLFTSFDRQNMTVGDIVLFGGEPLLLDNESTIQELMKQACHRESFISIVTNGFTLDYYAPILANAKVRTIQITLDGDRERHNKSRFTVSGEETFHQIIHGLHVAQAYNLPLVVRCNVELDEEDQIQKLLEALDYYKLTNNPNIKISVANVFHEGPSLDCSNDSWFKFIEKIDRYTDHPLLKDNLARIHELAGSFVDKSQWVAKYFGCQANLNQLVFDPLGNIYPCRAIVGNEDHIIGNFDENGIHYNDLYSMWRNRTIQHLEECYNCALAFFCGGGCTVGGKISNGKIGPSGCMEMQNLCDILIPYLYRKYFLD